MEIRFVDYNHADSLITGAFQSQWQELEQVLMGMPLHLKASDQRGIQGNAIFDPVGTNQHIAEQLSTLGWSAGIAIPQVFSFLGTGVDFGKAGVVVEVQFSNYPFLLNNVLRSELFFRASTVFHEAATGLVVIVTKAGMLPASNSTLYFEQAQSQLAALAQYDVFTVPIRLVGLFASEGAAEAMWTDYSAARYSRTVAVRQLRRFTIVKLQRRCRITPEIDVTDL